MNETEPLSIKKLYDSVADKDSVSYGVFRKKFHRLLSGNTRTTNRLMRNLGISVERPKAPQRDFIAYDGEGWGDKYTLLANSLGEYTENSEGLSTIDCLAYLASKYDKPIKRIFFSFSYDVNHIIKDFTDAQIRILLSGKSVVYEGYRVSYIPGKIFVVNGFRYYDVFGFFATSFINVVTRMLGPERVTKSLIEGKAGRGSFETWNLDKLMEYNKEELDLLVEIMDTLNKAFKNIGVTLSDWYGPGAVAKYWFKQYRVTPHEKHTRGSITALNSAYYGGRFEQVSLGYIKNVYEYDIHSAYPSVMAEMPNFTSWKHVKRGEFIDNQYSVWHVSFDLRNDQQKIPKYRNSPQPKTFMPLPVRSRDGRICFPMVGKGWYWYNEVKVMLDFFPDAKVTFHEGYVASVEGEPFAWVKTLYNYRRSLKDSGNLSQYAIKVGLNSLYGKTAQRVGRSPYFSLAWAGYITSTTRAKLARAGYENGSENIIGFATDALFSTTPLESLKISDELGDWEKLSFNAAIFFQSGIYRLITSDETYTDRYRGSPLRHGIDNIIEQLRANPTEYPKVRIGRFISNLLAIQAPNVYGPLRLQFVQITHRIALDAPYKRHYYGFIKSMHEDKGMPVRDSNYAKLLTERINSNPKVYVDDNHWLFSNEFLWGNLGFKNIESLPAPMKDANTQRLLEDADTMAAEAGLTEVSDLESLPVMEDIME